MRRLMALALLAPLSACGNAADGGHDAARALIAEHCGACHVVPGVKEATGRVGPSLDGIARQQVIAGYFANSRDNMIAWITRPQAMLPGNAMQDPHLTSDQAEIVADYLYTLD